MVEVPLTGPFQRLIDELKKLPGIGPRSAERIAFHLLKAEKNEALALAESVRDIQDALAELPQDVLRSITRSQGTRSGKLHELLATLELTKYDRLFYLGEPVDFVGVKYGEGVDFIEVKSGRSRLSEDEKKLKELIDAHLANYVPLTVQRITIAEEVDTEDDDYVD